MLPWLQIKLRAISLILHAFSERGLQGEHLTDSNISVTLPASLQAAIAFLPDFIEHNLVGEIASFSLSYMGVGRENERLGYCRFPNHEAPMQSLSAGCSILLLDQRIVLACLEQTQLYTSAVVESMVTLGQSLIKCILKHLRPQH